MLQLPSPRSWDYEKIYCDGDLYFQNVIENIRNAKESIYCELYIFENDGIGRQISSELIQACKRNVRVRIIVDGIGSPTWIDYFQKSLKEAGAHCKIYHPIPWKLSHYLDSDQEVPWLTKVFYMFQRLNKRNHRKVFIFDKHRAFVGSYNVSHVHLKSLSGDKAWNDRGIEIQGAAILRLIRAFNHAWHPFRLRYRERRRKVKRQISTALVRLNDTSARRHFIYKDLLYRIQNAKSHIWIANAYFVPDGKFIRALRGASKRGIEIIVMVSHQSDVWGMKWAAAAFYKALLLAKIRIFEYKPSVLHAKSIIIDSWAILGTSNLNHRSLLHDLEVDIVVTGLEAKEKLREHFIEDLAQSKEITMEDWQAQSWTTRFLGWALLLIRYFL